MSRPTMDISEMTALHVVPEKDLLDRLVKACCKDCDESTVPDRTSSDKTMDANDGEASMSKQDSAMRSLFLDLVNERSPGKFLQLRESIIESGKYTPYVGFVEKMEMCFNMGDYAGVISLYNASWPNCLLSPRVHLLLSRIYNHQGNTERHNSEETFGFAVLDLIMKTGDGIKNSPYSVLHLSDEADVLAALEKEKVGEELIECNGRYLDCVMTDDEQEVYFDVTDMILRGQDTDEEVA